jgi:hypothetical protein
MVHAATREQCEQVLMEISIATGIRDYSALYSTHEYKKTRVRYFVGDTEAWEQQHLGSASDCGATVPSV